MGIQHECLTQDEYYKYHHQNLIPTHIKIDVDLFKKEINQFKWQRWGDLHHEFPRFAVPLVNDDGLFHNDDPACYPLDRYNFLLKYPHYKNKDLDEKKIIEWHQYLDSITDINSIINERYFTKPTPALNISSLNELKSLQSYLYRCCIFKWDYLGHFKKHIDSWLPVYWIRLWGTTDPDGLVLRYEKDDGKMIAETNIEAGRLYLHDSIKPHEALSYKDDVYQFFICMKISALKVLFPDVK